MNYTIFTKPSLFSVWGSVEWDGVDDHQEREQGGQGHPGAGGAVRE